MQITVTQTPLKDAVILEAKIFEDDRGFFYESYSKRDFENIGIHDEFVQENHSRSQKGVLRGLHYQNMDAPMAKLVRCSLGEVYDVIVDLRADSPSYGKWFGVELTSSNKKMLYVPVGFAHGFQTVSDVAEFQYKQTNYYTPEAEGGIVWNDPGMKISWPVTSPTLSERDHKWQTFEEYRTHPIFS